MYDKLFGKILIDRGLATREQLDEALEVRERLLAVGLDRRIGEILVNRKVITQDVAEEIANQQKAADTGSGESVLGRLAVQNGLISQQQLNHALELQRAYFQESGVAPTLGYILVEEGLLTIQQLDALIAVQNRVKTRHRPVGALTGAGASSSSDALPFESVDGVDAARSSANYHVSLPAPGGGPRTERVLTGAAMRAMIRTAELNASTLVRREDQDAVRPLGDFPEFASAFTENTRYMRASTMRRMAPPSRRRSRAGRWARVAMVVILTAVLVTAFWLGRESGPATRSVDARAEWVVGDLLRYMPEKAAASLEATTWIDRWRRVTETDSADDIDIRRFMAHLGLTKTVVLSGETRYVPTDEAARLQEWALRDEGERAGLQPFEFPDGILYGVPVAAGIRLSDGTVLPLDRARLRQQVDAWRDLRGARAAITSDQTQREQVRRHLDAADRLDDSGWFRHARRERLVAFSILPEDPRVKQSLGFIGPGEDLADPTAARPLTLHELPSIPAPQPPQQELPAPWTAPGMIGREIDPMPDAPPWTQLMTLLDPQDVLEPPNPVPDPAADRRVQGDIRYLGYWLPSGPFQRWWPTARHASRQVLREGAGGRAEVWTDLPQFRRDILEVTRELYSRAAEYFRQRIRDELPRSIEAGDESFLPRLIHTTPCQLVIVGPGESRPTWVARGVAGEVTLVELTDLRSPEALVIPIAHGCFSAFVRATWGPALPAWVREALAARLADHFATDLLLDEWRRIEDTLYVEALLHGPGDRATHDRYHIDELLRGPCATRTARAHARGLYEVLLRRSGDLRLQRIFRAVLTDDRLTLDDETRRLSLGLDGEPWPRLLRQLAREHSELDVNALPLHAANTIFLTDVHLAALEQPDARLHWFTRICGRLHAGPARRSSVPGTIMAGYSIRELLGLAAMAARLRLVALRSADAQSVREEWHAVFTNSGRPQWADVITETPDRGDDR